MRTVGWTAAALGLLVTLGCTRGSQNTETFGADRTAPAAVQPIEPLPGADGSYEAQGTASSPEDSSAEAPRTPSAPRRSTTPSGATAWREVTIPAGTVLRLELQTALSSETAEVETPVRARVRNDVVINGYTAIPAGAIVTGYVTDVERPGRVKGRARLVLRFSEVQVGSTDENLSTNPITFVGEQSKGEDATKVGAGAIGGASIGGVAGGGSGAAKGAAIGAAAGTGAVLATRGKDVTVAAGTALAATPTESVDIRVVCSDLRAGGASPVRLLLRRLVGCSWNCGLGCRESDLRVGAVAKGLGCRATASAQCDGTALDVILSAVPIHHLYVVTFYDVWSVSSNPDCCHSKLS